MKPRHARTALRAGHRCEYCHAPEAIFNFPFEVEHVIPLAHEGTDTEDNLALACRSCNLRKATHVNGLDTESRNTVPLFHPRQDQWGTHFGVDVESGRIVGLTPTGRATVLRLEMNSQSQITARKQWSRLGLFP